ncbi:MAG: ABC transporter substrate-binding protein [Sinobacterium sp.]|jgi:phospholipid transport system substrate-binding protein
MDRIKYLVAVFTMILVVGFAQAQQISMQAVVPKLPQVLIQDVTDEVLAAILVANSYYQKDPERFYVKVEEIMAPVMDYQTFARTVMGRYGSSSAYRVLKTDEERAQFRARVKGFTKVFRQTIMNTYGKGLMAFNGEKITVLPLDEENMAKVAAGDYVQVVQVIRGEDGSDTKIYYKLKPDKYGEWKMRNVVIDTINLGQVYQSQFASAVKDNDGDIDKAIIAWAES